MVIMHIKIKVPSQQINSTSCKHYEKMLKTLYKILPCGPLLFQ